MLGALSTWLFWRGVKKRVAERGWTLIHLGNGRAGPVWAYSVGFWECAGSPEVILFGHDELWSNGLLSHALTSMREGLVLEDYAPWRIEGFEGVWRRVHPVQIEQTEWFNCARRYRRERTGVETFEAYQLVTPDPHGKYPWEQGFDDGWRHYQAELYLPTAQHGPHAQQVAAVGGV